jgi:hypothetical protein
VRQVDQPLTLSGDVTPDPSIPTSTPMTVTVTRQDSQAPSTMVGSDTVGGPGEDLHYEIADTPSVRGATTYTVAVEMTTATAEKAVWVHGLTTTLGLHRSALIVPFGHIVRLTAHLGDTNIAEPDKRRVTIYAKPIGRDKRKLTSDVVNSDGNLSVKFTIHRRTTFTAVFAGDSRYAPASRAKLVRARAVVLETLKGSYGRSGGYRLFHPGTDPSLVASVLPRRRGVCLYFRAQRYSNGSWHNTAVSGCVSTDDRGTALGVLTGDHVVGRPYRLRAEWRGDRVALARNGAWLRLKFHL